MSFHKDETAGSVHVIQQWEYADSTAREAATGFTATDVGKVAHQADNNSWWILYDHSPISWVAITQAASVPPHGANHEDGGIDEIDVTGLSGLLADAQTPLAHKTSHEDGGADELSVTNLAGLLADAQTPLSHSTTHKHDGGDEVATATPAAHAIPKADVNGQLDILWMPSELQALGQELPGYRFLSSVEYLSEGGVGSANDIQYTRVWLTAGQVLTQMGAFHLTLGNATRYIRLGIYSQYDPDLLLDGEPYQKVAETAQVDTDIANNTYIIADLLTSYNVPTSGYYWLAFTVNNVVVKFASSVVAPANLLGVWNQSGTGTLPSTPSGLTNNGGGIAFVAAIE